MMESGTRVRNVGPNAYWLYLEPGTVDSVSVTGSVAVVWDDDPNEIVIQGYDPKELEIIK